MPLSDYHNLDLKHAQTLKCACSVSYSADKSSFYVDWCKEHLFPIFNGTMDADLTEEAAEWLERTHGIVFDDTIGASYHRTVTAGGVCKRGVIYG